MIAGLPIGNATLDVPVRLTDVPSWHTHIPFGFWCVEQFRPRLFVELGTHKGDSYCAFCQAVERLALPTACYAIDTWKGDPEAGLYGEEVLTYLRKHHDPRYAAFSRLVRSTFDEAVSHFVDGSIDLLHIDGLHTYEAVRHDFETWLPKLSRSAVVLFHDVNVRESDFGAWRFWEEISARYPHFTFLHGHGLGVLVVGPDAPEPAKLLAARGPEEATQVRSFFAQQGQRVASGPELRRLEAGIAEIQTAAEEREVRIGELRNEVAKREAWIADLRTAAGERETRIAEIQQRLDDAQGEAAASRTWKWGRKVESVARVPRRLAHAGRVALEVLYWAATFQLRAGLRRRKYARLIRRSGMFDTEFYRAQCPDDRLARRDPILHYLVRGAAEGRNPNPLFDTAWYLKRNPDVAAVFAKGKNPLVHYIRSGAAERRDPLAHGRTEGRACLPPVAPALPPPEVARPVEHDHSAAVPFASFGTFSWPRPLLAVMCHLFHADLSAEFLHYLTNIPFPFDLFITTDTPSKRATLERQFWGWPHGKVEVRISENRGRDIAPKLVTLRDVYDRYEYVLHLHSKRSDHQSALATWRGYLLETLVGSREIVGSVFEAFAQDPRLGIVAAQHFEPVRHWINWGGNRGVATDLADRMGVRLDKSAVLDFPSGSMFWARSAALRPLLDLGLSYAEFDGEDGQIDGTLAHAIERLYYFACEHAGYSWIKIARPELCPSTPAIAEIGSTEDLRRYLFENVISLTGPDSPAPRVRPPPPISAAAPALVRTLQAKALGVEQRSRRAHDIAVGIVTYNNSERQVGQVIESAVQALRRAGNATPGASIFLVDHGASTEAVTRSHPTVARLESHGNSGFGAGHNRLMREAFERGANLYIAANPDGAFDPDAVSALSQMVSAHGDLALVEALQFPVEHPKVYSPYVFDTPWASGACLAIPKSVFEMTGGFDETFFMYCEDVDLSWRARAVGIPVRISPRALFLHAVTNRSMRPETLRLIYASAIILARKWGAAEFEEATRKELTALGGTPPDARPAPVPPEWRSVADFSRQFSFAPVRW